MLTNCIRVNFEKLDSKLELDNDENQKRKNDLLCVIIIKIDYSTVVWIFFSLCVCVCLLSIMLEYMKIYFNVNDSIFAHKKRRSFILLKKK